MAENQHITPEQIREGTYQQVEHLEFDQIIPFVQNQMRQSNLITRSYNWLLLLFLLIMLVVAYLEVRAGMAFMEAVAQIGYGVIITFLLIPLH